MDNIMTLDAPMMTKLLLVAVAVWDGAETPTVAALAQLTSSNERTVRRHIRIAESRGWLAVERTDGAASRYTLRIPALRAPEAA